MVMSPLICGIGNFPREEKEDKPWSSLPSTPRKTSSPKKSFGRKNSLCNKSNSKDSTNPYSTRGLDKFSALLAELEEKRQRIYSQVDPKDVSFVRFVFPNDNDCIPIVVKLKDNKTETEKEQKKKKKKPINREARHDLEIPEHRVEAEPITKTAVEEVKLSKLEPKETEKRRLKSSSTALRLQLQKWRRPSYYLPVAIILILLFLALFGRSFAILCTSLGWYILPTLTSSDSKSPTKNNKKKVYARRFSENKMAVDGLSSPKNNNSGGVKNKSLPGKHGNQKSR